MVFEFSFMLLRMLRFTRLLRAVPRIKDILATLAVVLPWPVRYCAVTLCIFYSYAVVGMELLAGEMGPSAAMNQTSYGQADYYALNFDTMGRSMLSLFFIMVGNNWAIIMEGAVAASGTKYVRIYFVSWCVASRGPAAGLLPADSPPMTRR